MEINNIQLIQKKDHMVKGTNHRRVVGDNHIPVHIVYEQSLADIFSKVDPKDKAFLKHVPDGLLDAVQALRR